MEAGREPATFSSIDEFLQMNVLLASVSPPLSHLLMLSRHDVNRFLRVRWQFCTSSLQVEHWGRPND